MLTQSYIDGSPVKTVHVYRSCKRCNTKAITFVLGHQSHSVNSTGCQSNGSSSSTLLLLLARLFILKTRLISRLLIPYRPSRVLRPSSSSNFLQLPRLILLSVLALSVQLPTTVWNSLPDSLNHVFNSFQRHLKTYLFRAAFNTP